MERTLLSLIHNKLFSAGGNLATKAKTRFVALIDGVEREIFSVVERQNKDIIVMSGTPRFWENPDGSLTKFGEQHYSVHTSNNGVDVTITQKTTLSDGNQHSNVAYIKGTKNALVWPIYARRVPIFEDNSRLLKARKKDTVIRIGKFSYSSANFLYSIFVTRSDFDIETIRVKEANFYQAFFNEFSIVVITNYLNLPSLVQGDVTGMATSNTVVNGEFSENHTQLDVSSQEPCQMINIHQVLLIRLKDKMLGRISKLLNGDEKQMTDTRLMATFFTNTQIVKNDEITEQGGE